MTPPASPVSPLLEALSQEDIGAVRVHAPLADYCTWRMGGPADLLVEPASAAHLARILAWCREHGAPCVVIGEGSNLLFDDAGLRGVVVRLGPAFASLHIQGTRIAADAGVHVADLAWAAQRAGLAGLEHAVGIPGTLGGLVAMNGGSRRQAIGDVIVRVSAVDHTGALLDFPCVACGFGYRTSVFQRNGCIVVGAELDLPRGDPAAIKAAMEADVAEREAKFPLDLPSCGSVFKNSDAMYAAFGPPGKVIEDTQLKGLTVGQCQVSSKHANFFVNLGGASSADMLALIGEVRARVCERTGIQMECEVRYVSPQGAIMPAHDAAPQP
ncbi:UDP-N-acetylmuramate dehydrogenase [Megalodesulfovibrio gigas]|uniref:UDP-N-acetylenolpyruvoylglucosamine reductase n=1 Tax=Megalodesulfovibrio gigas (strain ATCC 19364 / DSM 1382 / NCIMB 9332 / VKM B-1759) TaxID=1121448 RepID=T2GA13_MEGG1|nr:UDP-N-acetylmuramate dehydrogenase [Megalodesulfovibrio gigas]AGW13103.1 putative UDP-N-acetylmuramate dehydrogenase [Megalodesulfovibrio gigas DSM 1382 = ATCC 19364]